jgi:hypothetical protein
MDKKNGVTGKTPEAGRARIRVAARRCLPKNVTLDNYVPQAVAMHQRNIFGG